MDSEKYLTAGFVAIGVGLLALVGAGYFLEEYKGIPLLFACLPVLVGFRLLARGISMRGD